MHAVAIEKLASYGDPAALARLREIADADLIRFPERGGDKTLAQLILNRLGTVIPGPGPSPGPIPQPDRAPDGSRHILFTLAGTFVDELTGFPADVGRAIDSNIYRWVPIKYPATFGNPSYASSVQLGVEELIRQIKAAPDTSFAFCGYSQGGEVVSRVFMEMQNGELKDRMKDFIGAAVFGNPMRELGHTFVGNPNPNAPGTSSRGIADVRLSGTPETWADYVNAGDLYADVPEGEMGLDITSVYKAAIQFEFSDSQSPANPMFNLVNLLQALATQGGLLEQILRIMGNPVNLIEAIKAAGYALAFVTQDPPTKPHVTYHAVDCMPGQTSLAHAIVWLNRLGAQRPVAGGVRSLARFVEEQALTGSDDAVSLLERFAVEGGTETATRRAELVLENVPARAVRSGAATRVARKRTVKTPSKQPAKKAAPQPAKRPAKKAAPRTEE
jgi:hypothetical protein